MLGKLKTENVKLGPIAVTYRGRSEEAKRSTCPPDCPLRNKGCYAKCGPMAWGTKRAEKNPKDDWKKIGTFVQKLPPRAVARFHVKGDFYCNGKLDKKYILALRDSIYNRWDIRAWTYTHATGEDMRHIVDTFNLTPLCVNVSVDNLQRAVNYYEAGLPTVVTVGEDFRSQQFNKVQIKVCSAQLRDTTCKACGICANRHRKFVVAFRAHGSYRKQLHTTL